MGYGLKQARQATNSLTAFTHLFAHAEAANVGRESGAPLPWEKLSPGNTHIPSPCYAMGMSKEVELAHTNRETVAKVTMTGTAGGFEACQRLVEVMLDKDAECHLAPCSFAGHYQPSMSVTLKDASIIALSYFYDRIAPLDLGDTFALGDLEKLAHRVCSPPSTWESMAFSPSALKELQTRPEYCLDLTFMHTLLRLGYELDNSRKITLAKKIGNFELGWALGAELAVLSQGVHCK